MYWPIMAPVWVFDGPNEYIFPSSEWFEWDWQKIPNNNDQFEENADFGHFRLFLACYGPGMSV